MCKVIEDMRMESFQEGKLEGKIEGIKLVAMSMLETGKYAIEEIASLSGLSLEEVKTLK